MRSSIARATILVCAALFLGACGGSSADLSPEIAAHLSEYEVLIEQFEPKFATVRNDPSKFAGVADSYSREAQAWLSKWDSVAPDLSDEEARAVKSAIKKLNRRAKKMLTGA
jgi:hypothetical protein